MNLAVVPPIDADFGDGDGGGEDFQDFDELMLMAQRLLESAIANTDWSKYESVAKHLVVDPAYAKVIVKLMHQAKVAVYFETDAE